MAEEYMVLPELDIWLLVDILTLVMRGEGT